NGDAGGDEIAHKQVLLFQILPAQPRPNRVDEGMPDTAMDEWMGDDADADQRQQPRLGADPRQPSDRPGPRQRMHHRPSSPPQPSHPRFTICTGDMDSRAFGRGDARLARMHILPADRTAHFRTVPRRSTLYPSRSPGCDTPATQRRPRPGARAVAGT